MIRKSGTRFSEKIMLKQKARAGRRFNYNSSCSSPDAARWPSRLRLLPRECLGTRCCGLLLRSEISVQGCDHLRAFADGGRDPLGRARADIADGIDAAAAGLQRAAIFAGVGASQHEALGIERHAGAFKPS